MHKTLASFLRYRGLYIIGVAILFFYGLPSRIVNPYEQDMLSIDPLQRAEIEGKKRNNNIINFSANLALALIFIGFIFQFVGTLR